MNSYLIYALRLIIFLSIFIGFNPRTSLAVNCTDGREYSQNMPLTIGREDQVQKFPFVLNCDTMFVRKGVTTTIFPGSILYFAKPTLNAIIKVEGTLVIKGSKNSYVILSGSLDSIRNGIEPGNKPWGGIEVEMGGALSFEYVGFMRAPTPITTFSQNVNLSNCWFKGSSGMILADGTSYNLDVKWHAINNLDLTKGNGEVKETPRPVGSISEKEKSEILTNSQTPFWNWKKISVAATTLALVGAGTAFYLVSDNSPTAPITDKPIVKPAPAANLPPFNLPFPIP